MQEKLRQLDAIDASATVAVDQAVTDAAAALTTELANPLAAPASIAAAQATYDLALDAAAGAATAQTTALMDGAANKPTPLSPEAQAELDSLLAGKIDAIG
jgi:hypothetical protein